MRIVVVHPEMGIYLGSFLGLGFFSKLDCAGQTCACTFADEADARDFVGSWVMDNDPNAYRYVPVTSNAYAEIAELEAAGLDTAELRAEVLRNADPQGTA